MLFEDGGLRLFQCSMYFFHFEIFTKDKKQCSTCLTDLRSPLSEFGSHVAYTILYLLYLYLNDLPPTTSNHILSHKLAVEGGVCSHVASIGLVAT